MNKLIILVAALFFGATIAMASDLISKSEFTDKYVQTVVRIHPDAQASIASELEVKIVMPGGKELTSFLDNAYTDYSNQPDNLEGILATYIGLLPAAVESDTADYGKEHIFPVIKDRLYIEQTGKLLEKDGKNKLVYEQLNDILYIVYAFDTPTAIRFLSEEDLGKLGIERNGLRELAMSNLKDALPEIQLKGDPSSLSMIIADGNYESSLLLADKLWTKDQFPVKGDIVVYVPTRDVVLITGSEDATNLSKAYDIVNNPEQEWSHMITSEGFVRVNGKWQVFKP